MIYLIDFCQSLFYILSMNKILKYASLIAWFIGVVFMVIALFTMNKWISIPMVLFLIAGSLLNYIYTRKTYVTATLEEKKDVDNPSDK